jgi:hypothetical protein
MVFYICITIITSERGVLIYVKPTLSIKINFMIIAMRNTTAKNLLPKLNVAFILLMFAHFYFSSEVYSQISTSSYTTASGNFSETVPAGTTFAIIQSLGAGGGGGGGGNGGYSAAGGGGGGAFSMVSVPLTPGQVLDIVVGARGNGSPSGGHGADGGLSKVSLNGTILCSAQGGFGGNGFASGASLGGVGGSQGVGFLYRGGKGGNGNVAAYDSGGGGGGAAGSTSNGNNGANGTGTSGASAGGTGGTGGFGSGNGGNGCSTYTNCGGSNSLTTTFGAGGGGGSGYIDAAGWGGNGSRGKVVIIYCNLLYTVQPSTSIQNVCLNGATTTLSVAVTNAVSYQWYSNTVASTSGGTLIAGATSTTYTPPSNVAGTRFYYCIATAGTCTLASAVSGAVNVATASIVASGPTTLCGGGSVTLTANAPGASSYSWSTGASTNSITVSPTTNTTYTVNVTGTCNVTSSILVKASPALNFSCTATAENLNGYNSYSGDVVNLNAYPINNNLVVNGFNGSFTGSLGGTWTTSSTGTATVAGCTPAVTAMPTVSIATTDNSYAGLPGSPSAISPYEGSGMASFNSGTTASGNVGFLTSPSFSTVGFTGIILDFYFLQFVNSSCGENMRVEYSIGGGAWTVTNTYTRAGVTSQCPSWMNFSEELPAAVLGQADVRIRFRFLSTANCLCGRNMIIDNVRISGVTNPGGYGFYNSYLWTTDATGPDLGIVSPTSRATTSTDFNNQSTGANTITFNVTMTDQNGCVHTCSKAVNINPTFNGGLSGTMTANPPQVCMGGSSTITLVGSATAIQWQSSTTSASAGFTDIPGANSATYVANNITQTTWFRVRYTSPNATSGSCMSSVSSPVVQVTVLTFNPGILQNTGETINCTGDPIPFGFQSLPSGSGSYTYTWYAYDGTTASPTGSTVPSGWSAVSGPQPQPTSTPFLWTENFDGVNNWVVGGNFAVAAPGTSNVVTAPRSAPNVLGTVSNGLYGASCTEAVNFAISPTINLTGVTNPVLKFWTHSRFRSSFSSSTADGGRVYVSTDNGVTWSANLLSTYYEGSYTQRTITMPAAAANNPNVKIMFTMYSDGGTNATGYNIDDLTIEGSYTASPVYDPAADPTNTTSYAVYIEFTGGACTFSSWAQNDWEVGVNPCSPLPIVLTDFDGYCSNDLDAKVIFWSTLSETNNAYFEIEGSEDGENYYAIKKIEGAGTTSTISNYREDILPLSSDEVYYRLKQVDYDGQMSISDPRYINCKKGKREPFIYPNPSTGAFTVILNFEDEESVRFEVINLVGQVIFNEEMLVEGSKGVDLNFPLAAGNYILRVSPSQSAEWIESIPFIITK